MKILLAVDGSKSALQAVDTLIEHAELYRDRPTVELVTVHPPVPRLAGLSKLVSKAQIQQYYKEEGEAQLAEAKTMLENAGIDYEARVLVGPVAEILVAHAKAKRCGMIFIGSRGLGAARGLLLGSTVTRVLHLAGVPVLVAR
jgi:nucleotide-binding universal stress UspA family protein